MSEYSISQEELDKMFSFLHGLKIKKAMEMIGHNMFIRIAIKDGIEQPLDTHFRENRLNVEMKDKKIVKILTIG